jgi:fermentation-respiration switch protein FrsA (DUF1100 family)
MKAYVWKQVRGGNKYTLQIEVKRGVRALNKVEKLTDQDQWKVFGSGGLGKVATLLYSREFESENDLKKWANTFPCEVIYQGTNGKVRTIGKRRKNA